MYTILNKQNDYRTNKTKLTLMENKYTSLAKLVSNLDGNLTENMLLEIKSKQDITYNKLVSFYSDMDNYYHIEGFTNKNLEYTTLDENILKPFEEGYINYVNMNLLTSVMKNEESLKSIIGLLKNDTLDFNKKYVEKIVSDRLSFKQYIVLSLIHHATSNHVACVYTYGGVANLRAVVLIIMNYSNGTYDFVYESDYTNIPLVTSLEWTSDSSAKAVIDTNHVFNVNCNNSLPINYNFNNGLDLGKVINNTYSINYLYG